LTTRKATRASQREKEGRLEEEEKEEEEEEDGGMARGG